MGLSVQGRPGPPDQVVIPVRRAGQEEQARGQVALAPGGRGVVVVLQHGRAELVVVGVVPLEEHQPPRRVDQRPRVAPGLQVGQRLAGGGRPVAARLREDLLDRPRAGLRRRDRFEPVDPRVAHLAATAHRPAEQGEERGVLEHQQPAGPVVAAGLEGEVQGVGRGHGVERDEARLAEQQLAGAVEQGVPDRLRGDPAVQERDDLFAGIVVGARAQRGEQVGRGRRIGRAPDPIALDPVRALLVASPGPVGRVVAPGGVAILVHQQGTGQRPQDRLGVLPADALERPTTVGHVDRLVADRAEVAGAVPEEQLVDFVGPGRAGQGRHGRVGRLFVPPVHRRGERLAGPAGGRDGRLVHRPHRPVALADVLRLRALEVVERPEDRQPAVGVGRGEAGQMGRVDRQHGLELVADAGPRLHVAHPGQEQRREHVAVGRALPHPGGHLLQEPLARGLLQEADEGLDLGLEAHHLRVEGRLVGRDRPELGQEAQVAQAQ